MKKSNRILLIAILAALASISIRAQTTGTTTGTTTGATTGTTTGATTGTNTGTTTGTTTGTSTGTNTGTTTGTTTGTSTGTTTGTTTLGGTTTGGTTTGGTTTGGTTTVGTTTAGTTTGGTTTVGSTTGGSTTAGKTTSTTTAAPEGGKGKAKGQSAKKGPNDNASQRAKDVHAVIEAFQAQRATYLAARKTQLETLKAAPDAEKARILAELRAEKEAREEDERSLGKQIREDLKKLRDDRKGGTE